MEIAIYFHDGGSYTVDDIDNLDLKHIRPKEIQLVFFNGLTLRLNEGEKVLDHRRRTHQLGNGEIISRYYCLLTTERKCFFFCDGAFVGMPEGGERDAHWRTFARLPASEIEVIEIDGKGDASVEFGAP